MNPEGGKAPSVHLATAQRLAAEDAARRAWLDEVTNARRRRTNLVEAGVLPRLCSRGHEMQFSGGRYRCMVCQAAREKERRGRETP